MERQSIGDGQILITNKPVADVDSEWVREWADIWLADRGRSLMRELVNSRERERERGRERERERVSESERGYLRDCKVSVAGRMN